ncbi:MAG: ethanolamine utilization protein EutN [Verrucomicrobia bacterium]|nr:ethanolamine utilization protein EutN [Verrucomicrobiota bacterium]
MKLGTVIGRVTLSVTSPGLDGARWLLVSPWTRDTFIHGLSDGNQITSESSLVIYDNLGGGIGDVVGYIEGREAASPFVNPPPIDAINAALIDKYFYTPRE